MTIPAYFEKIPALGYTWKSGHYVYTVIKLPHDAIVGVSSGTVLAKATYTED